MRENKRDFCDVIQFSYAATKNFLAMSFKPFKIRENIKHVYLN